MVVRVLSIPTLPSATTIIHSDGSEIWFSNMLKSVSSKKYLNKLKEPCLLTRNQIYGRDFEQQEDL